jgi:hypothetical protein
MAVVRLGSNPLITPESSPTIGENINGPSVIRVPAWVQKPLGKYYLYFAHHRGQYIRMAYADSLQGPWKVYEPGVLQAKDTAFAREKTHIASPDVHVDDSGKRIVMYFHGQDRGGQHTQAAVSADGLAFKTEPAVTQDYYLRVFRWGGWYYGLARTGNVFRSKDPLGAFEPGGNVFAGSPYADRVRHVALMVERDVLYVFFSGIGDAPERIMVSKVQLTPDWKSWKASAPETVLAPEKDYECVKLPVEPSEEGQINKPVRQLRDPAVFVDGAKRYLFYSVCGESGIAAAEW